MAGSDGSNVSKEKSNDLANGNSQITKKQKQSFISVSKITLVLLRSHVIDLFRLAEGSKLKKQDLEPLHSLLKDFGLE